MVNPILALIDQNFEDDLIYKSEVEILKLTRMYDDRLFKWLDNHNNHYTFIQSKKDHDYNTFIRIDMNYVKEMVKHSDISTDYQDFEQFDNKYFFIFVFQDGSYYWPFNHKQLCYEWNFNAQERHIKFGMFHKDNLIKIT